MRRTDVELETSSSCEVVGAVDGDAVWPSIAAMLDPDGLEHLKVVHAHIGLRFQRSTAVSRGPFGPTDDSPSQRENRPMHGASARCDLRERGSRGSRVLDGEVVGRVGLEHAMSGGRVRVLGWEVANRSHFSCLCHKSSHYMSH